MPRGSRQAKLETMRDDEPRSERSSVASAGWIASLGEEVEDELDDKVDWSSIARSKNGKD